MYTLLVVVGVMYLWFNSPGVTEMLTNSNPNSNGNLNSPDSTEEKLRKIVNRIVDENKQFADFKKDISLQGLDTSRFGIRAFGHLVLLRHSKGLGVTSEDIKNKLSELGI